MRTFGISVVMLLAIASLAPAQSWVPLTHKSPILAATSMLMTDGSVMVHDTQARDWWRLIPDANGSYVNGTWKKAANLPKGYSPLYYASAVLPDGRLIIMGGEYNLGKPAWTTLGAIYDPVANTWQMVPAPDGWTTIGDAESVVLADGTFLLANCCTIEAAKLDPNTLTWTPFGSGKADSYDEEGWTLLPSGKVLTVDVNNVSDLKHSEILDPSTGVWSSAGSTVVQLDDLDAQGGGSHEIGPSVLRPDGTVFWAGATGHNALYHSDTGTWSAAPDFPPSPSGILDVADGPAALLPDGNVLVMTSPGVYQRGAQFLEWDGANFSVVDNPPQAPQLSSYVGRMLVLPTGEILFTDCTSDVEVYQHSGVPDPAWAPTITAVSATLVRGNTYMLQGTQLNGLSQGGAYGDDAQAATNFPLVRITNIKTGRVYYARTHDHSTMAVATGNAIVSTEFDVPAKMKRGPSQLEVVANGIASAPVAVTIN